MTGLINRDPRRSIEARLIVGPIVACRCPRVSCDCGNNPVGADWGNLSNGVVPRVCHVNPVGVHGQPVGAHFEDHVTELSLAVGSVGSSEGPASDGIYHPVAADGPHSADLRVPKIRDIKSTILAE